MIRHHDNLPVRGVILALHANPTLSFHLPHRNTSPLFMTLILGGLLKN